MPAISITLVRECNSAKDVDDLLELAEIFLCEKNIKEIDNLDVFNKIERLHLRGNLIKEIDNLDLLFYLKYVDLSYNRITSTALSSGMSSFPNSVTFVDISGNPCASDDNLLNELRSKYSKIEIVSTTAPPTPTVSSPSNEVKASVPEAAPSLVRRIKEIQSSSQTGSEPAAVGTADDSIFLNADTILEDIVNRKCQLQAFQTQYNFGSMESSFKTESEDTVSKLVSRCRDSKLLTLDMVKLPEYGAEKEECKSSVSSVEDKDAGFSSATMSSSTMDGDGDDFMSRLRKRADNRRTELFQYAKS